MISRGDGTSAQAFHVTADLHAVLRKYWGYDQFRPLQGRIVESLIGGNDTCVVMPTGGGKSLCYQLPAVVSGRTAVVVSPLIALMQDQAAQLEQMGISAAALNSQVTWPEQQNIMRRAAKGEYRLLYVSPERLLKEEFIAFLSARSAGFLRHRRSPLHFRVGSRIPPGIPAVAAAAGVVSRQSDCGVYGKRDEACAARYIAPAEFARAAQVHRQFSQAESELSGSRVRRQDAGAFVACGYRGLCRGDDYHLRADHCCAWKRPSSICANRAWRRFRTTVKMEIRRSVAEPDALDGG